MGGQNFMAYRIDEACTEDWDAMEQNGRGRFCQACKHDVIDATNMTKREFDEAFKASSGNVCARFRANPLGDGVFRRELPRPRALGSFVLLSTLLASACGNEAPLEPEPSLQPAPVAAIEPLAAASDESTEPASAPELAETIEEAREEEAEPVAEPIAAPAPVIQPIPATRMGGVRHF